MKRGMQRSTECSVTNEQENGENCQEERLLQLDLKFNFGGGGGREGLNSGNTALFSRPSN